MIARVLAALLWVLPAQANDGVLQLVNEARTQEGLAPLVVEQRLMGVAQRYADLMMASNCVGHGCDPAGDVAARIAAAGYQSRLVGEALAAGPKTAAEVVAGWLNSPPHRKVLLSAGASEIGLGFAYDEAEALVGGFGEYWVLLVADPL